MKTKLKDFIQHLYHEIDDEDKAEEYLDNALPSIGLIVMYFNSLESSLDSVLCENFTDRTDSTGLIVLNKMNFASKVDLFKRFCDDFQVAVKKLDGYELLINDLQESSRLRNMVVHANWESTDEEGYTYIRLKISKNGMKQEYVQFTQESLQKIIELILKTRFSLEEFWEYRNDVLHNRV
ncbi:hypothetical protein [Thiomicrorhabdus lithotrophica]|uniref:pEK499-p136 HEPN domain-containing protein n=1 Tax=Thiomicrorhabdus lithotrophica TaxID=2949997 RepID=A0ABY8C785_9GAMM|nr:hypothetical protein [Thiomicrorhabdus lithotrophica]WEJ61825.1 hypothetical protein NR989_07330 [Thiomicrorhabdus lithotrophica]